MQYKSENLFFDEQEAVAELKKRGYRVTKDDYTSAQGVNTIQDLVTFFYSRRKFYTQKAFPLSIDYSEDRKYISSFVQSREKLGLGRKTAIKEAAVLIDAMFRFEDKLHLKEPILSPKILTSRPFIDRICFLLWSEGGEQEDLKSIQRWNEQYNLDNAEREFQRARKNLDAIKFKMETRKADNVARK